MTWPWTARLVKWLAVPISQITIVAPGKQNLLHSALVQRLISAGASAGSTRQRGWSHRGNILALWLDDKSLADIELSQPRRVALAPWNLDESLIWRMSRHPEELSGTDVPQRAVMDPVVRRAMVTVAEHSNPNNGCLSYNRDGAVQAFRILRRNQYVWDPIDTAVIMAEYGWRLDDARDFAQLSSDMLAGKALRGANEFRSDILRIWRKEALDG